MQPFEAVSLVSYKWMISTRPIRATKASEFYLSQFDQRPVATNEQREVGMRGTQLISSADHFQ
jgi:hypothetical protein